MSRRNPARRSVLVVDIGGSSVKFLSSHRRTRSRFKSGQKMTPEEMMRKLKHGTRGWTFDCVTLGYPGVVRHGKITREPHNLGSGWIDFDFDAAFGCPVRIINDAAMQALGAYRGGTMLFLGLGTGLGSALVVEGQVIPMELGHLHCSRKHTYEHYLGEDGRDRLGQRKWQARVFAVVIGFTQAMLPDEVVIGGGNARKLKRLPPKSRRGSNADAFTGGFRLWKPATKLPG